MSTYTIEEQANIIAQNLKMDIQQTAAEMMEMGNTETDYTPMQERVERWGNRKSFTMRLDHAINCAIDGRELSDFFSIY